MRLCFLVLRLFVVLLVCISASLTAATGQGWVFTKIAQVGEGGFTALKRSSASADGKVVVLGTKDGATGLYLISGGVVTAVAVQGATLNATLGQVGTLSEEFHVDGSGRVVFKATLSGGTLSSGIFAHTLRWEAGTYTLLVPDSDADTHVVSRPGADGRWAVERLTSTGNGRLWEHLLTDGTTAETVGTYSVDTLSSTADNQEGARASGPGHVVLLRSKRTETKDAFGFVTAATRTTELIRYGSTTETLVTATKNSTANEDDILISSGDELISFTASETGDTVAYRRNLLSGGKTTGGEIVVLSGSSTTTYPFSTDSVQAVPEAVDAQGRVILSYADATTAALQTGLDPGADRIVGVADTLFGTTLTGVTFDHAPEAPGTFGDRRSLVFRYRFGSGSASVGVALATRNVARWTLPAGGAWSEASAWSTQSVPTSTTEVLFDLDATYDVQVGTASVGRASVEHGSVAWRQPALTFTGGLALGSDGSLTQSEGEIAAGELTIGSLPSINISDTSVARLRISNKGTVFRTSGEALVGRAGKGELAISGATVSHGSVRIGAGSEGAVTVGAQDTLWTTGALSVGDTAGGTLAIENSAHVLSTSAVIGRGDEAGTVKGEVIVDNGNKDLPNAGDGNWLITGALSMGARLPGKLTLLNGGTVTVGGAFQVGTVELPSPEWSEVVLDGTGATQAKPSYLNLVGDVVLAAAPKSKAFVLVESGGLWTTASKVSVAGAAGSTAQVLVGGVNANAQRANWMAGDAIVRVGDQGEGTLFVTAGGLAEIPNLFIGGQAGSKGEVYVTGSGASGGSALRSVFLVVGGDAAAGTSESAPGTLTVQDVGSVEVSLSFLVSKLGRLQGDSTVLASSVTIEGTVAPGAVAFEVPELFGAAPKPAAAATAGSVVSPVLSPGTLTLQGNVEFKPGARLEITVGSGAEKGFDKLKVEGALKLDGTLALSFVDGYAPAKGDTFDVIASTTSSGAFSTLETTGVASGFLYSATSLGNGNVRLTALNDAVPATAPRVLTEPQGVAGVAGKQAVLSVTATGSHLTYQWRRNGVALEGATASTLTFSSLTPEQAGNYDVVVSNAGGSVTSATAALTVTDVKVGQLFNLSVRTALASEQNLIVGFVVADGSKSLLLRGVGPGLAAFLSGTHPDPTLSLYNEASVLEAANDNWQSDLAMTMASVGAFPLAEGSTDAALLRAVGGLKSAHVHGPGSGVVLVELYDAEAVGTARLINVSARNQVSPGEGTLIAGFGIRGAGPLRVLIRGIGPTLQAFGITTPLADPVLTLYQANGDALASNDDWPSELSSVFGQVGAFSLTGGSRDAALSVVLEPGVYTVHLQGKDGGVGEGLIEVYEVGGG